MKKGPAAAGPPSISKLPKILLQMVRQMLVHFEHADAVLAPEDLLQLVVSQDFPFVLRVLQVVFTNVIPHLRNDLAARQRRTAADCSEIRRRLNRASQSAPRFTTSPLCHQALLLFPSS